MRSPVVLICVMVIVGASYVFASDITDKNWMNHPEIKKVRSLYNEIESAIDKYKRQSVSKECAGGNLIIDAEIFMDSSGGVRKYVLSGGTGDSAGQAYYYYDSAGINRFTFQTLRAVNGTHMETRYYFDENGQHLYTNVKFIKGPGWAGGFPGSVSDPASDFKLLCEDD